MAASRARARRAETVLKYTENIIKRWMVRRPFTKHKYTHIKLERKLAHVKTSTVKRLSKADVHFWQIRLDQSCAHTPVRVHTVQGNKCRSGRAYGGWSAIPPRHVCTLARLIMRWIQISYLSTKPCRTLGRKKGEMHTAKTYKCYGFWENSSWSFPKS